MRDNRAAGTWNALTTHRDHPMWHQCEFLCHSHCFVAQPTHLACDTMRIKTLRSRPPSHSSACAWHSRQFKCHSLAFMCRKSATRLLRYRKSFMRKRKMRYSVTGSVVEDARKMAPRRVRVTLMKLRGVPHAAAGAHSAPRIAPETLRLVLNSRGRQFDLDMPVEMWLYAGRARLDGTLSPHFVSEVQPSPYRSCRCKHRGGRPRAWFDDSTSLLDVHVSIQANRSCDPAWPTPARC